MLCKCVCIVSVFSSVIDKMCDCFIDTQAVWSLPAEPDLLYILRIENDVRRA